VRLYHGTCAGNLERILDRGLEPRRRRKGNWKQFPSRPDMVYLTNAYAPFFAISAAKKNTALVLEVEPDPENLYPDEDFISQVISAQSGRDLEEVHKEVLDDLEAYGHLSSMSLEGLGNASHRGKIPASRISRYCILDTKARPELAMTALDPSISIMNYRFCGSRYRSIISWLFGDRPDFELMMGGNEIYFELMKQPGAREQATRMFEDRTGIQVRTNRAYSGAA
jgi:hypothetical protein